MRTTVKSLLTGAALAAVLTGAPALADEATTPGNKNMNLAAGDTTNKNTTGKATTGKAGDTASAPAEVGDFNARGEMLGSSLIGAEVRNKADETIGEIEEVYVDNKGAIKGVVVQVGGFLGVDSRYVNMPWNQLSFTRDKNDKDELVVVSSATKETLQKMPEYKYEKRNGTSG